jgi:hypothetical protein
LGDELFEKVGHGGQERNKRFASTVARLRTRARAGCLGSEPCNFTWRLRAVPDGLPQGQIQLSKQADVRPVGFPRAYRTRIRDRW